MIFTTINPNGNFEAQNEALLSWSSKFSIYSVNTKEEIDKIKDIYKYVNFIETDDVYDNNGKNMIRLNAALKAIKKTATKYACIINSDIILDSKVNSIFNKKYLDDGIIISTRHELDGDKPPYPFVDGYDLFVFDIKYIDLFLNKNYVIGMPWWDFWIPYIAIKAQLKVYHIKDKIIYHRKHQTNYNMELWIKFGEFLYEDIMIKLMDKPINVTIYDFCLGVKAYIEKKQINIKIK